MRRILVAAMAASLFIGSAAVSFAEKPGPGTKQCSPGQNNIGGGPGNSGPGDQIGGAPLKLKKCPGGG